MPPVPDRSPSAFSNASPGRRIISRLASPFAPKARNVPEFGIEVDDPHKQHSPGDIVTGSVRVRVTKPIRVTHIAVCLHGYVQVFKNPGSPPDGFKTNGAHSGNGRGKKSGGEYFGNGFASLFEDEVVLCGDGRLAEGTYQFKFELEFPDRDLPSSIDFERGTISYMITATMTRPTTISPVITCDRKVFFVERIDISPLFPPNPRTITLEPLTKRSRARSQARKLAESTDRKSVKTDRPQPNGDVPRQSQGSSGPSMQASSIVPESLSPSEESLDSRTSTYGRISQPDSQRQSRASSDAGKASLAAARVITATIESQAGGCLRGDYIPIKVNVDHTKHIKSLYGVIVTLYRSARVDMNPAIPLGPVEKGISSGFEDYYPKSLTGLGGLSLSGAGSSHLFRKDLSQVMLPLMIDPQTLTAEVNAKIRVPEEAFPTISTVPGAMISFKYYVEVILDVQGKLAGQDRNLGNLGISTGQLGYSPSNDVLGMSGSLVSPLGSHVVDTASVRRDKSVVTCTFEVVVGTRDSERRKGKRKVVESTVPPSAFGDAAPENARDRPNDEGYDPAWQAPYAYNDPSWYQTPDAYAYGYCQGDPDHYPAPTHDPNYDVVPPPVPIPEMPDEAHLSEKERLQRAEARLLPSEPPGTGAGLNGQSASAPYMVDQHGGGYTHDNWSHNEGDGGLVSRPVAHGSLQEHAEAGASESSVPAYEPPQVSTVSHSVAPVRGEHEAMPQQRLQDAESVSLGVSGDNVEAQGESGPSTAPSAPTLEEAEAEAFSTHLHDSHAEAVGSAELPRYER